MSQLWLPQNPVAARPEVGNSGNWRWATVTQQSPLRIRLDGETDPLPVTPDTLLTTERMAVGDRVWVQLYGRRVVVVGRANALAAPELPTGVDLNNYTTPGVYVQSQTADASGGTNYPRAIAGVLEVIAAAAANVHVWQRYTPYGTYGTEFYLRELYNGTWYGWYRYSATNVATGAYSGAAVGAAAGVSITVNFPTGRFTATPRVMAIPTNSSRLDMAISAISTTSFTARLDNFTSATAAASDFNWIAVQEQ